MVIKKPLEKVFKRKYTKRKPKTKPSFKARKKGMFLNIFEKKLNAKLNLEALNLLGEFIETLNQNNFGNFELREVISPEHILEVRSFAKV